MKTTSAHRQTPLRIASLSALLLLQACGPQQLQVSALEDFARFGRDIDIADGRAVIGAADENGGTGAVYVFARNSNAWSIDARVESPSPADEQFGRAVAISGNTMAIGAPLDHKPGAVRAGSVYMFERDASGWTHTATLGAPAPQAHEAFGVSVALDANRLVIGAVDRDQGAATDAGGAFVYERAGTSWILVQSLAAPSPVSSDKFGNAVEVDGSTIVVGALRRNVGRAADAGAVYVYERDRAITLEQTLVASDGAANDVFGTSLALQLLSDGSRRLVVGAENVDIAGASNAGAAYVFESAPAAAFSQSQKLVAGDPLAGAIFGTEVALFLDRILVGAPAVNGAAPQSGATYVFERSAGAFSQVAKLERSSSDAQAHFGSSVALEFGYGLVGATGESIGTLFSNTGAAHAYSVIDGAFVHNHVLTAATVASPFFRRSSLAERFAISGSPHADVYRRDAYGWSLEQHFPPLASTVWTGIGMDGTRLAISGRRGIANPAVPIGYVHVFSFDAGHWTLQQQIEPDLVALAQPDEAANSLVVDIEEDTLVIGARRWNGGDGRVFVWKHDGAVWAQTQLFTSPQANTNFDMNYGSQVILSGNTLVVSERPSSGIPGSPQNGNVFIYTRPNDGADFSEQQVLSEAVPSAGDMFGLAVGFDGDVLAVYSGAAATLRVYDRQGNSFSENWNVGVTGIATEAIAVAGERIALGVAGATVDGIANAGEVRVYQRQPDDSYALEATFTAPSPAANMHLGWTIALDDERVVAGTASGVQFTFEL